jgi:DNA-directed RNA polymerase subunit beta'
VIPLTDRILGRSLAEDLFSPLNGEIILSAGSMIDEAAVELIEDHNINHVKARSPITCDTRYGVCAKCYGRDLGRGHIVNRGEAVGVIAAQSIGEPGTQLTMRTFHIGGAATAQAAASNIEVKKDGTVTFHRLRIVKRSDGRNVAVSRSGELVVHDSYGVDRERYKVPYGAELVVNDGDQIKGGQVIATWDPHTHPIISEVAGQVSFSDMIEGLTAVQQVDDLTGSSTHLVLDSQQRRGAARDIRPAVSVMDGRGSPKIIPGTDTPARYQMPEGATVLVADGAMVGNGQVLARIPQEVSKTRDITGGLPRVAELFEARKAKDPAVLATHTGVVSFGKEIKTKNRLVITDEAGTEHEMLIPKISRINVFDGEHVERGEEIVDGQPIASDILDLLGVEALANFMVNEVQEVYRLQGVKINDKHIEVITRQMLRKVRIIDHGDSAFLNGDQAERSTVLEENEVLESKGKKPVTYAHVLLGITKASLSTESFISAASFQETTRVLTDASMNGKVDRLRGLKENVIVGRLIPAGTGLAYHEERRQKKQAAASEQHQFDESEFATPALEIDGPEEVISKVIGA